MVKMQSQRLVRGAHWPRWTIRQDPADCPPGPLELRTFMLDLRLILDRLPKTWVSLAESLRVANATCEALVSGLKPEWAPVVCCAGFPHN
jgi:hypothetical protein